MTISRILTELVRQGAVAAGHADSPVPLEPAVPCQNPDHGDYQSNFAFRLGKSLRTNPRAVAERLATSLPDHPAVARVDVAGPGFLNIRLDDAWLAAQLADQAEAVAHGYPQEQGTVVIDFSAPNVAKRMHVGHLRSTVIGSALVGLYRFAGYTVVGDNHIGDWGTPFGKLIVAWHLWADADAFAADPIAELERIYVRFSKEATEEQQDAARAETAKLQAGDPDNRALWERFVAASMTEYQTVYDRLGISFEETLGESAYQDALGPLVDQLLAAGVAKESDGAIVVPFSPEDGKGLGKSPLIVRKVDGAHLYGTTDLATVRYRIDRWAPARIVYVTDTRQQLHFRQFFTAARKMGWVDDTTLLHVWFGLMSLPEGAMSSRKGNVIHLVDLLDEAASRARVLVDAKSPELPDDERAAIAEAVGCGAVRYADLSQNPQSNVAFDWDKAMAMDGNTAPFLMYGYARCRSLQRKGGVTDPKLGPAVLEHALERALAVQLARFPEAVQLALSTHRPNLLCDYLYQSAQAFNRFYHEHPVLDAEPAVRESRLALVEATARVLRDGMQILGLTPLERM